MAKKLSDETLELNIVLNGNKAQQELGNLAEAQRKIMQANKDLRAEKTRLAAAGEKESEAYKKVTAQLKANNAALKTNKTNQEQLRKQIGLTGLTVGQLVSKQRQLRAAIKNTVPNTKQWDSYNDELQETNQRLGELRGKMRGTSQAMGAKNQSVLSGTKNWLAMATGIGAAVEVGRQAVTFAKDFIVEGIKMADQARGVEFAFRALGKAGKQAFEDVKKATRGTLSNLDIKTALVNFGNFDIPQDKAGVFFEFLTLRATQTGQDIKKLQDSLVEGLSKQSKLRIDNLGISTAALNAELEKTPDFITAVANIAKSEIAEAGDIIDQAASGAAKWSAATDNLQLSLGSLFGTTTSGNSVVSIFSNLIDGISEGVTVLRTGITFLVTGISTLFDSFSETSKETVSFSDKIRLLGGMVLTSIGSLFINLGKTLGGVSSVLSALKSNFIDFFKTLSVFAELEIDLLNPAKTFQSFREFDFTGAFSKIKNSFTEGGKSLGVAFAVGYEGVARKAIENINSESTGGVTGTPAEAKSPEQIKAEQAALKAEQNRLRELSSMEEKYLKEKEDRLAASNEAQAILDMKRAIAKAEALKAEQDLLDSIRGEHQIKIEDARALDQKKELDALRSFEDRKRALQNEIDIQNAATDQEKELLKAEQDFERKQLRLERELEDLNLTEEQKTIILAQLTEIQGGIIDDIKAKWRDKELSDEEKLAKSKRKIWNDSLNTAISIAGRETKVGQALLLAKQLLAVKEAGIALGVFKTKAALNTAEAKSDIAKGQAKTISSAAFPANIPLVLGFVAQVAGIISTLKNISSSADNVKTQGFEDGLYPGDRVGVTRTDGKKFNAAYGGRTRTGIVSGPTYFRDYIAGEAGPEMVIDNRTFRRLDPSVIDHIMNVRGYEGGLPPTSLPVLSAEQQAAQEMAVQERRMMMSALTALNATLSQPITAITRIGYDEDEDLEDLRTERINSTHNGTIAS